MVNLTVTLNSIRQSEALSLLADLVTQINTVNGDLVTATQSQASRLDQIKQELLVAIKRYGNQQQRLCSEEVERARYAIARSIQALDDMRREERILTSLYFVNMSAHTVT